MTTATTTGSGGQSLRAARESAGITRAQLAGLAGCSLASLAAIEQGATPRRSLVLDRAWAALNAVNERARDEGVRAQASDRVPTGEVPET
jgi:transcriptional regulator with XRE-family HTH domain